MEFAATVMDTKAEVFVARFSGFTKNKRPRFARPFRNISATRGVVAYFGGAADWGLLAAGVVVLAPLVAGLVAAPVAPAGRAGAGTPDCVL